MMGYLVLWYCSLATPASLEVAGPLADRTESQLSNGWILPSGTRVYVEKCYRQHDVIGVIVSRFWEFTQYSELDWIRPILVDKAELSYLLTICDPKEISFITDYQISVEDLRDIMTEAFYVQEAQEAKKRLRFSANKLAKGWDIKDWGAVEEAAVELRLNFDGENALVNRRVPTEEIIRIRRERGRFPGHPYASDI